MSAAMLSDRVGSACNVNSHSLGPVQLGSACSVNEALRWVHTCNVTAYRNTVSWQCGRDSWPLNVTKSWLRGNVTGMFGVLSVFGHRVKGMIRLWPEQVWTCNVTRHHRGSSLFFFDLLAPEFYILILAHPVRKMRIILEPKKVALWNKRYFEEKNGERTACLKYSVLIFVEKKNIKCNIWRVAVRPSYI